MPRRVRPEQNVGKENKLMLRRVAMAVVVLTGLTLAHPVLAVPQNVQANGQNILASIDADDDGNPTVFVVLRTRDDAPLVGDIDDAPLALVGVRRRQ